MTVWTELVEAYRSYPGVTPSLKIATLAQWIVESGRGESELAIRHHNFAGLKFRARMAGHAEPIDFRGSDNVLTTYCRFGSVQAFIDGYWHFIRSGPYAGWDEHKRDGAAYIRHLVAGGYCPTPGYAAIVIGRFDEARELLLGSQDREEEARVTLAKLAVIIGHNSAAPGAVAGAPIGRSELTFNTKVARLIDEAAAEFNIDVKLFSRQPSGGYSREIRDAYAAVAAWGPDCALELHFNAAGPNASGTEMLYPQGSSRAKLLASHVQEELVALLGLRNRGPKAKERGERGARSLFALPTVPTVLAEPFFGSNRNDCNVVAAKGEEALALAYLRGVRDWAMARRGAAATTIVARPIDQQPIAAPVIVANEVPPAT